jgi:hypothetical protein
VKVLRDQRSACRSQIRISSMLDDTYRDTLEKLLFFNPGQHRVTEGIEESIVRHGAPEVRSESGLLHIQVGALGRVQALFALEARKDGDDLVGVIVYCRASLEDMVILHVAVSWRFASLGPMAEAGVALRLFQAVRQAAARLKGVSAVSMYLRRGLVRLPVSSTTRAITV